MSATLDEQVAMVADVFEVHAIDATQAVTILREACGLSSGLCARLLRDECRGREADGERRDREAEEAREFEDIQRDIDGGWTL